MLISDLMLDSLSKLICNSNAYKMQQILTELCDDEETINYRLDIIDDLVNMPELVDMLKKIVRIMIDNDKGNIYNILTPDSFTTLDSAVTAFEAYIQCIEYMHSFNEKKGSMAKSAGVRKMLDFFERCYSDKHYKSLCDDVHELKDRIKGRIKSIVVAINLDEALVPVSAGIVEISDKEYTTKPTVLDRIIYRGAKFNDQNVMGPLKQRYVYEGGDKNSKDRIVNPSEKALFEELDFITKKYVELVDQALDEYKAIGFKDVYSIEYQLDYYTGIIALIKSARSKGLEMCRPKILPSSERRAVIKDIFDPIYFSEAAIYNLSHKEKREVITNDISLDENGGFYILTGANNGGKTTFVRAVGLCQLMAQAGLYVPASSCEVSICDMVYTHFPKEEQKGIDASRFTTEIKEFKDISDVITNHSLLLMNESIQSTTPKECVDIAVSLVHIFAVLGVRGVFATHLVDIAPKALKLNSDPDLNTKIESITVNVDKSTGERLYKIIKGLPNDTSYANTIFEKFGLDFNALKEKAKQMNR
ncbi:MAG: DNA mismatch repair protein MutS [Ruminococcus sp.]|nr:DNA mismatch repair protein MutS [Ruminococcus sp.]